jgi:hypothetical protein
MSTEIVEHLVDPELLKEFEPSVGTVSDINKRYCPSCKKGFKVARLGEHVRKAHPEFWEALFTVETLQHSIDNKCLVRCTIAEKDHDQKFLICLACDSIRTTDRDHFKKNGKIHSDQHFEAATKLLAKKKGEQYVPLATTNMEKLLTQLDKYKRRAFECDRDHDNFSLLESERDDALMSLAAAETKLKQADRDAASLTKRLEYKNKVLSAVAKAVMDTFKNTPKNVPASYSEAISKLCGFVGPAAAEH